MKNPKTNVIFRKAKNGEVIAFFPDTWGECKLGMMMSYAHHSQHGEASIEFYRECKPCTEAEYRELYDELTKLVGYNLNVKQRISHKKA